MLMYLTFQDTTNTTLVIRSEIADSMDSLGLYDSGSDSDPDVSTICSKNDSKYSDSNYDTDDKEEMIRELGHVPGHSSKECVIL